MIYVVNQCKVDNECIINSWKVWIFFGFCKLTCIGSYNFSYGYKYRSHNSNFKSTKVKEREGGLSEAYVLQMEIAIIFMILEDKKLLSGEE